MATVFWDRRGVLLVDFMPQGTTIYSGAYCTTLRKFQRALQNKRCGMQSKSALLLHDNASPHTSRMTLELIESFSWEVLDHAPYGPDFAPSDSYFFRYLKHSLASNTVLPTRRHSFVTSRFENNNNMIGFFVAVRPGV
ncbi:mariner Mos1 transposase [Trichonephila clavipes]|nr:mariner Mos1 transposase [Trichonephila clavipes]